MRIDIPTMITTALIVMVVTFALTLAYTNTDNAEVIEVEKIIEVERKLTADEQRAVECYRLFNVWVDIPSGAASEDRALDRAWAECTR